MNKTMLNMEDWKETTDGGWMNTKTGETLRGSHLRSVKDSTSPAEAVNTTDYEVIDDGVIMNTYTGDVYAELWEGGLSVIDGELHINRSYFTDGAGDYYTPYKSDKDDARIRNTYGAENYDDVSIYDPSMEDEKIVFYDEDDNITDSINLSATHRKKYRKRMLKEIGQAELKKDRQKLNQTIDRWIEWAINHHDGGAYDILNLYKKEKQKEHPEMNVTLLWECLHPFGKYYEAYAE